MAGLDEKQLEASQVYLGVGEHYKHRALQSIFHDKPYGYIHTENMLNVLKCNLQDHVFVDVPIMDTYLVSFAVLKKKNERGAIKLPVSTSCPSLRFDVMAGLYTGHAVVGGQINHQFLMTKIIQLLCESYPESSVPTFKGFGNYIYQYLTREVDLYKVSPVTRKIPIGNNKALAFEKDCDTVHVVALTD